ncbi:hypothetical protein ACO2Q3_09260 [Caulobacter sp. KR2-114]|uniref:hypothetical protein n=1 Tax=Caulobacter sp. KR2-114 TaxID=3400912 RepID=UPI003BFB7508
MNRVSIGAALGEGFSLMRRKPLSVLSWGLLQAAISGGAWMLYLPMYATIFSRAAAARGAGAGAGAAPDPAMMAQMMQMQGLNLLLSLASAAVTVVVYCAAFRAVLFPDQRRFAYMRLSMAELLLGVVGVVAYFAFIIALVVVMIPVIVVVGIFSVAHQPGIGVLVGVLVGIAAAVAAIYVGLRFSLLGPLTVRDKTLNVSDAWAITKGHVASLFGIAACQVLIVLFFEIVLVLVLLLLAAGVLGVTFGLDGIRSFMQHPTAPSPAQIIPWAMFGILLFVPIAGGMIAFMAAPWARVLNDLTHSDALEAFA